MLIIFAADHGIARGRLGLSARGDAPDGAEFPRRRRGGQRLCRSQGVPVHVVDAGVAGPPLTAPALLSRRIARRHREQPDRPGHDRCQS